ncbi:NtaA/DmoA family FMN-dependent monooxygenase [Nesterenkonia lutea]|uniref:FMN-dependent oxidoreductase (Nitrilotriacetate monooxygenase family) n=1 Tax=Nesterenkonia lutea TaxID=272919 RepID=A0ABR9JG31_9MICC|nr:NtaA/DmoA family FMN-dependent monooxygenase [Nesterenkonia lutea]MBE1524885.1 FMN-dependent oxidoreductase (nitrilotriacetate monooxygenase family) [Nesterenkonia lutea]
MTRRPLILSAFLMNTTSHIIGGAWRREEAEQHRFNELGHWTSLVKKLEDAGFDIAFFADVVGLYGDHEGGWASHVRRGLQIPANDPLVLLSALAAVTDRIGLALTSSVIQAHPFTFARQLSTLDHLSGGRVGWNVVTSAQENAHRNYDAAGLALHEDRYAWAEEYLDVCYKLWEGSWTEEALLQDKAAEHERGRGLHADPAGVSKINHVGARYSVEGPHLSAPSPQRTPFLFQAGSSDRGRDVAAQHAEATFSMAPRRDIAAAHAADVKDRARRFGRSPEDVSFIQGLSFVIGATEAEAAAKAAELDESIDDHALIAHTAGSLGVDVGHLPIDTPLDDLEHTEQAQGHLEEIKKMAPNGRVTLRDLARFRAQSTRVVGTPEQIADELADWQDAGIDGINVINSTIPGSYDEFIEHVLPVLRDRGLARRPGETDSGPVTLRARLTGSDRLPDSHPAAGYRGAFSHTSAEATEVPREAFLSSR